MLLGAMEILTELKDTLCGRVIFCFESDEENGSGWPVLLPVLEGLNIDTCFAIHVLSSLGSGKISLQSGGRMCGMVAVDAQFVGKGGHGSRPDLSVNPVFAAAAALSNLAVAAANRITPGEVLTLGITAIQGGSVFNVIPDRARILGTMRYFNREIGQIALDMEKSVFDHTAAMYGCTVEYAPRNKIYLEPVVNDADCVRMLRAALPGGWLEDCEPWYASETFSVCMNRWPGALAFLGIKNETLGSGAEHHNEHFDVDESALWRGAVCYAAFAVEALK
jgi:amidohydrolase